MKRPVFIYGTLRDPAIQRAVFGRQLESVPDHLDDHGLAMIQVDGKPYPNVVPEEGSAVEGDVVALTEDELRSADEYETAAYERRAVVLASGTAAEVYIGRKP